MHIGQLFLRSRWMIIGFLAALGLIAQSSLLLALPLDPLLPEVRLTPPDVKPAVYGRIYRPAISQPAPAVIVMHGFSGIFPDYRQFAQDLAAQGYVAMMLDYYGETGRLRPRDKEQRRELWPVFEQTVQHAIQYLQTQPEVDGNRIGLVGISMGASLAVSTASLNPAVKAAVAYYGPAPKTLDDRAVNMPPLLVLHGDADSRVKVDHANTIRETLTRYDRTVVTHIYPGAGHGFNIRGRQYDAELAADAQKREFEFLATYLQPADPSSADAAGAKPPPATLYDTALHFYTVDRPALTVLPGGDIEQLFALPVYDHTQYQHTDDRGRVYDLEKRRKALTRWWNLSEKRGYSWFRAYKVEAVEQTDDTHGEVTYIVINSWELAAKGMRGITLIEGMSSWEKQGDHWRIVATKTGRPYRAGSMAFTREKAKAETGPQQAKQKSAN